MCPYHSCVFSTIKFQERPNVGKFADVSLSSAITIPDTDHGLGTSILPAALYDARLVFLLTRRSTGILRAGRIGTTRQRGRLGET